MPRTSWTRPRISAAPRTSPAARRERTSVDEYVTDRSGPAALNLGRRPTFYTDQPYVLLEAYLLDFSGDLYGQRASVGFVERIRSEERFHSVEALIETMHRDIETVRRVLELR